MKEYLLNICFFILVGMIEASLWHYASDYEMTPKEKKVFHQPLLLLRASWFVALLWLVGWVDCAALICCYPFWHLGVMYKWRHKLNNQTYLLGFFDETSSTSTSVFDKFIKLNFPIRLLLLVVGTAVYFIW
jgi:hypothetical protein